MKKILLLTFIYCIGSYKALAGSSIVLNPIEQAFPGKGPLGSGSLYAFIFKIYDIALWANSGECAKTFSCRMALQTLQSLGASREKLIEKTLEKICYYHPELSPTDVKLYKEKLETLYPEKVESGDIIQIICEPEKEGIINFYYKAKGNPDYILRGSVKDRKFSQYFFEIWLHPNSTYSKLRQDLLGESS